MNNVYDNGELLLGTKKDILEYQNKMIQQDLIDKEDYKEIIDFLEELEEDTIVCVNYDNGMGLSFDWWTQEDIVKVGK